MDREEENPLEPSKFEKILKDVQISNPEYWEEFKKIPNGIRSPSKKLRNGRLLLACESGSKRSGKIIKYYLIDEKDLIEDISSNKALGMLESKDENTYQSSKEYDKLVSIGWKRFLNDIEQINAKSHTSKVLSIGQRWILKNLMEMATSEEYTEIRDEIETLRKAFSIPVIKGKLSRELLKLRKSETTGIELIDRLKQFYIYFELQKKLVEKEEDIIQPRILYSRYVEV